MQLIHSDCLEKMKDIPDKSIHAIICDLPFGITAPEWDSVIDMKTLWKEYSRIVMEAGVIALFASQPFTTKLIHSNIDSFKYCWYWIKNQGTNFFHAKRMPIRKVEEVCILGVNHTILSIQQGTNPPTVLKGVAMGRRTTELIKGIIRVDQLPDFQ